MRIIGFNFTKLSTEKFKEFTTSAKNINISFKDINEEKVELLKDFDSIKVSFEYIISHLEPEKNKEEKAKTQNQAELAKITIEGNIILALKEQESKDILKQWKKNEVSPTFQVPLYNTIFKKCTPILVYLSDSVDLPSPVPIQKIQPKKD